MGVHDIAWLVKACSDKFAVTRPSWNGRVVRLKYLGDIPYFYIGTDTDSVAWIPFHEDLLATDYQIVHPYPENSDDLFADEYECVPALNFDEGLVAIAKPLTKYSWYVPKTADMLKMAILRIRKLNSGFQNVDPVKELVRVGLLPYGVCVSREEYRVAMPELIQVAKGLFMYCDRYMPEGPSEPCQG